LIFVLKNIYIKSKMGVLSKFSPTNWRSGGFGKGDFHIWVENPYGEVIDPVFSQQKTICKANGLDINKRRFQEWDNQEMWLKKHYNGDYIANWSDELQNLYSKIYPQWARCPMNARYKYWQNPDYYRVVIGSAGWGKKGRSSLVWYEYG
jgi:hypothetical protein